MKDHELIKYAIDLLCFMRTVPSDVFFEPDSGLDSDEISEKYDNLLKLLRNIEAVLKEDGI